MFPNSILRVTTLFMIHSVNVFTIMIMNSQINDKTHLPKCPDFKKKIVLHRHRELTSNVKNTIYKMYKQNVRGITNYS